MPIACCQLGVDFSFMAPYLGMFPVLSGISVLCITDNHSSVVRNIFGGATSNEGMGMLSLCLDWNLINSLCFWAPLSYQLNIDIGIFLAYIMMSALYYGNDWGSLSFPFMSQVLFVSHGNLSPGTTIRPTPCRTPTELLTIKQPF